jgi:hypothetical protein
MNWGILTVTKEFNITVQKDQRACLLRGANSLRGLACAGLADHDDDLVFVELLTSVGLNWTT